MHVIILISQNVGKGKKSFKNSEIEGKGNFHLYLDPL